MHPVNLVLLRNQLLGLSLEVVIGNVNNSLHTTLCGNIHYHKKVQAIREMTT